jgi:uncharacterized protein DUF4279
MTRPGSETAYTYTVSLRIWHPRMTADEISSALSLTPRVARAAGSLRSARQAGALEQSTYWTTALEHDPSLELAPFLEIITVRLQEQASFFETLRASHGRAELFVGWFLNGNTGEVLPSALLRSMAELGLDLALDLYPPAEPRTERNDARVSK